jgi:uncharacterized protein YndB with AHSA1/START domain
MDPRATLNLSTPSDREIVITRTFNATRHLVWRAMTTPELIRQWMFLPPGWSMTACEEDTRPGGSFRWAWNDPEGRPAMTLRGAYREVVPPERIVRTETFEMGCDAQAGEQLVTLVLSDQGAVTRLTLTILLPSKEARDALLASGMEHGLAAGYNQLEALLAAA